MELFNPNSRINVMGWRHLNMALSVILAIVCYLSWVERGDAKFGVDFRGGVEIAIKTPQDPGIDVVRKAVSAAGVSDAVVQAFEDNRGEYSIRMGSGDDKSHIQAVRDELLKLPQVEVLKEDIVGPAIGEEVRRSGLIAFLIALACIFVYVMIRFEWTFGLGAVVATLHDALLTTGIIVMVGKEINGAVLAALLTIVGYSVNDTIVVYDRIRENLFKPVKGAKESLIELFNRSINETFSRTILTSTTTLFVCACFYLLGSGPLIDLGFTLAVGIILGTYSSIFIASPIVLLLQKERPNAAAKTGKDAVSKGDYKPNKAQAA
ncbi:protein translocase subunit SecF [bacterium]|nr:protein translocase subunit SecF [bacterium]